MSVQYWEKVFRKAVGNLHRDCIFFVPELRRGSGLLILINHLVYQSGPKTSVFQWKQGGIKRLFFCRIGRISQKIIKNDEYRQNHLLFYPAATTEHRAGIRDKQPPKNEKPRRESDINHIQVYVICIFPESSTFISLSVRAIKVTS